MATQMLGNADDAADAVHDVFAKVLRKPQAFDAKQGALTPWFLRVLRNHCIDVIRRRRPLETDVEALREPGPGPAASFEIAQRDLALQTALRKLSAGQREIIVLRDYMDLSYAEIADVLALAPGTVMSRLHRARLALKENLCSHGE